MDQQETPETRWRPDKSAYSDLARDLIERHRGPVTGVEILPTWGPTIVAAARLANFTADIDALAVAGPTAAKLPDCVSVVPGQWLS